MKKFARVLSLALVALTLCALFAACAPAKDPADAEAALKEAEYITTNTTGLGWGGCDRVVTGTKLNKEDDRIEYVAIYYFESSDKAKEAFEDVKDNFDDDDEETKDWVFKRSGKIVYYGTKDAISAAR